MKKVIAICALLGLAAPAGAGYGEALAALSLNEAQAKALDGYLALGPDGIAANGELEKILSENARAIGLFIEAAAIPNEGYLFGPKPERLSASAPMIKYGEHLKLYRLLLLDARAKSEAGYLAEAERDLLAAAGFMLQLTAQKYGRLVADLVHNLCVQQAYPIISESIVGNSASAAYLNSLSSLLARNYAAMDFMRAAMLEEGEILKGTVRESVNAASVKTESDKASMLNGMVLKRLGDQEYFDLVYARIDAVADARAAAWVKSFETNDGDLGGQFVDKQVGELEAKVKQNGKLGVVGGLKAALLGGSAQKSKMADSTVHTLASVNIPGYEKLVPRYHTAYCMLGVLRTALAVKAWQRRSRGRLPPSLDSLVPDYLSGLPRDSFNKSSPFNFIKAGKRFAVYGYGPDRADGKASVRLDGRAYFDDPAKSAGDIVYAE